MLDDILIASSKVVHIICIYGFVLSRDNVITKFLILSHVDVKILKLVGDYYPLE